MPQDFSQYMLGGVTANPRPERMTQTPTEPMHGPTKLPPIDPNGPQLPQYPSPMLPGELIQPYTPPPGGMVEYAPSNPAPPQYPYQLPMENPQPSVTANPRPSYPQPSVTANPRRRNLNQDALQRALGADDDTRRRR